MLYISENQRLDLDETIQKHEIYGLNSEIIWHILGYV